MKPYRNPFMARNDEIELRAQQPLKGRFRERMSGSLRFSFSRRKAKSEENAEDIDVPSKLTCFYDRQPVHDSSVALLSR